MQYVRNDANLARGNFRVRGEVLEVHPGVRRDRLPHPAVRGRDRADPALRPAHRRDPSPRPRPRVDLAGDPLRDLGRHHRALAVGDPHTSSNERASSWLQARARSSRPTACASAPSTTWRCSRRWASARGSRTTRGSSTGGPPGSPAAHADRLLPRRLHLLPRRVAPDRSAARRDVRGRPLAQADTGRLRLPAPLGDGQPAAALRRVPASASRRWCSCPPRRARTSASTRPKIVEQIVRPTGIVDPEVEVRETRTPDRRPDERGRACRAERNERVLVTTLTKKMAEDLTGYLLEYGFRVRYLHSEIDTIERIQIIRDLRLGEYDVLVGVNLLREGLDLPEVSLVGDPRRRQGGLPARGDQPDPDDRAGGAQRRGPGADVRRPGDRAMRCRDRRDRPPPRDPGRLQREHGITARDGQEGHLGHAATSSRWSRHGSTLEAPAGQARRGGALARRSWRS